MTNRDRERIAHALRDERQNHEGFPAQVAAIDNVSKALAVVLRTGNCRFDSAAFLRACGMKDTPQR